MQLYHRTFGRGRQPNGAGSRHRVQRLACPRLRPAQQLADCPLTGDQDAAPILQQTHQLVSADNGDSVRRSVRLTGSHRDVGKYEASFLKLNPDVKSHVTADHMLAVKTAELNRQIEAALVKRRPDDAQKLRLQLQGVRQNFLKALRAHDMPGLQRAVR